MPTELSPFRERLSIPRARYIHLTKSSVDEHPSSFPNGAPMETDARLQSVFYLSSRVPSKGPLPPGSVHRTPIESVTPHLQIRFQPSLKFPSRTLPPRFPTEPLERGMPFPRAFLLNPGYPVNGLSLETICSEPLQGETPYS
jgi:hypothetical protein